MDGDIVSPVTVNGLVYTMNAAVPFELRPFYRDTTLALILESERTSQNLITGKARATNTWVDFRLRRMIK